MEILRPFFVLVLLQVLNTAGYKLPNNSNEGMSQTILLNICFSGFTKCIILINDK